MAVVGAASRRCTSGCIAEDGANRVSSEKPATPF